MSLKVTIFILWLSIFISSHSAADTHSVVISKATPNLKIKQLNPDGLYGASMEGTVRLQATVRFGWFEEEDPDFDAPMIELYLSPQESKKLPRMKGWTQGYWNVITVTNEQELIEALFSKTEQESVTKKKTILLERDVPLVASEITFVSECGIRYQIQASVEETKAIGQAMARVRGMQNHC